VFFSYNSLKIGKYLVISDLHSGIESLMIERGAIFPKIINKQILEKLKEIQEITKTNKLIINGDIKHEFSKELSEILDLKNFFKILKEFWDEILIIKGNHDLFIENIAYPLKIPVFKRINIKNKFVITHGDKYYKDFKEKTFIIGNEHPSLKIRELNIEKPVFLVNKYLIVMPAFNPFLKGSNILNKSFLSPYFNYLEGKERNFNILITELFNKKIEIINLGKVKL
jgi:putative SbcD/Mre11-related phosphoesterase